MSIVYILSANVSTLFVFVEMDVLHRMFYYKSDTNEDRPWSKLYEEDIVEAFSILLNILPGNMDILVDPGTISFYLLMDSFFSLCINF